MLGRVGRALMNIHFIPWKRKRHLGPVKMIKALLHTSNVRYEEDTILFAEIGKTPQSKGRNSMFMYVLYVCAIVQL